MTDAAAATASQGTGNGAGSGTVEKPTWVEQLPEAMRTDESLYGYKTIGDLVTGFKTTAAERDSRIQIPGENATDEERAAYYTKMGRPETADGYKLAKPDGVPDGLFDNSLEGEFRQFAFTEGLPAKAVEKLWTWYHQNQGKALSNMMAEQTKATEEAHNALKDTWKNDFPKNAEIAIRAFKAFGKGKETLLDQKIGNVRFGDHPAVLELFHAIGSAMANDSAVFRQDANQQASQPSEEEIAKKMFPSMAGKG